MSLNERPIDSMKVQIDGLASYLHSDALRHFAQCTVGGLSIARRSAHDDTERGIHQEPA